MRQRELMSKKAFLALPEEKKLQLANDLLGLLSSDLIHVEQRKVKTDTNPPTPDLNALEAL